MPFWRLGLLAIAICTPVYADPGTPASQKSVWHYGVEWRLIRAGTVRVEWTPQRKGFNGDLRIESAGLVSKLYRVDDTYHAQMQQDLCASTVNIHAEEGKRRRETNITFANGQAAYVERDLLKNNAVVVSNETQIPACVYEYIGGLQHLRDQRFDVGQSIQVPLSDGKKAASVRVEAQEREQVTTPLGKFRTIRYEVMMFNNVLVNKKARLHVWLTDDERRVPVQIRVRMQFLIGTIELKLEKQE